jgi:phage regulator Rha-like protein
MTSFQDFPLVQIGVDGQPRASTEAIALGFCVTHEATMKLVRRYQAELYALGSFGFEIRKSAGRPVEYALLNQEQSAFLLTCMRNTKEIVKFKVALIQEFKRISENLANRDLTMWERRIRLEAEDMTSKAKGSIGSRLMLDRKNDIPKINAERFLFDQAMQPSLIN